MARPFVPTLTRLESRLLLDGAGADDQPAATLLPATDTQIAVPVPARGMLDGAYDPPGGDPFYYLPPKGQQEPDPVFMLPGATEPGPAPTPAPYPDPGQLLPPVQVPPADNTPADPDSVVLLA